MSVATEVALDAPQNIRSTISQLPPHSSPGSQAKSQGPTGVAAKLYRGLGTTRPSHLTPPTLPEGVASVAGIHEPWFAIHSRVDLKGSRDFALAWELYLAGLPFYHPQAERIVLEGVKRERRKKIVSLFSGYVFAAGEVAEKSFWTWQEKGLADCILHEPRAGQIAADLLLIEASLKANPRLQTCEIDRKGIRVRVTRGPWINKEGVVDDLKDHDGTTTVYLRVETLGRLTPLELDISDLERV